MGGYVDHYVDRYSSVLYGGEGFIRIKDIANDRERKWRKKEAKGEWLKE